MTGPRHQQHARVESLTDFDNLKLEKYSPIQQVGEYHCLVKIAAASFNYRELMVPMVSATFYV
jgi:hypothetical protein